MTRRLGLALATACGAAALSGCGSAAGSAAGPATPPEVASACGHPGAVVVLRHVPLTVRHAQCDLTGVVLRYGGVGVTVPTAGEARVTSDGVKRSPSLVASVDRATHDVTVHS